MQIFRKDSMQLYREGESEHVFLYTQS